MMQWGVHVILFNLYVAIGISSVDGGVDREELGALLLPRADSVVWYQCALKLKDQQLGLTLPYPLNSHKAVKNRL